ncbi:MAG: 2TM domain-containing protein [Flavobacteriaceae bacterium]|nr:2TM domain-containing protein [Flavobacteriaceae bacterium]
MFSKSKKESRQESEQREQYEYAQERINQKKGLLSHLIYFVVGSIILAIINLALGIGKEFLFIGYHWYIWAIVIWAFLLLTHVFNVLVKNRFMGKEWEHRQLEKLKSLQEKKIAELEKQVEKEITITPETKEPNPEPEEEL